MVIYLTNSLIGECNLESDNPLKIDFFNRIIQSRSLKFNFLLGDIEILEILANLKALSDEARFFYNRAYRRFPTNSQAILNHVNFILKIGSASEIGDNYNVININDCTDESFLNFSNLLLENSNDAYLYEQIIKFYIEQKEISNIEFNWNVYNGGGNTVLQEFTRLNSLKRNYTFCLLDSDRIAPEDINGATAAQFVVSQPEILWGNYQVLVAHELENLISKNIYINYMENNINRTHLDNINVINNAQSEDFELYIDYKKGINKKSLKSKSELVKQYYYSNINNNLDLNCDCEKVRVCNCFLFHPLGTNIFSEIKNHIEINNINIFSNISRSLSDIYLFLGKILFSIFCKPSPTLSLL